MKTGICKKRSILFKKIREEFYDTAAVRFPVKGDLRSDSATAGFFPDIIRKAHISAATVRIFRPLIFFLPEDPLYQSFDPYNSRQNPFP